MLTFLFLVGLTATTLLLLSVAAEEILRVSRALLTRRGASDNLRSSQTASAPSHEHPIHGGHDLSEVRQLPQRARVAVRPARHIGNDQVPDRAA